MCVFFFLKMRMPLQLLAPGTISHTCREKKDKKRKRIDSALAVAAEEWVACVAPTA